MENRDESHSQEILNRSGLVKTDAQMPTEQELYRGLIRKDSEGGRFLARIGESLAVLPRERGYMLYSMYRQAVVEQIPIGKLSLLRKVQDPAFLREYITCIQDGIRDDELMQLLETNSGVPVIRQRRQQVLLAALEDGDREKGRFASAPTQLDISEMLQYNKKVLDYIAGDYTKLRELVPDLQKKIAQLEQDLKHAKQQLYSQKIESIKTATKKPLKADSAQEAVERKKFPFWQRGKAVPGEEVILGADPEKKVSRKEQLLSLLSMDLQTEQLRLLTEIFKSNPEVPFEVLEAVAKRENSLEDMENYINCYIELAKEKEEEE